MLLCTRIVKATAIFFLQWHGQFVSCSPKRTSFRGRGVTPNEATLQNDSHVCNATGALYANPIGVTDEFNITLGTKNKTSMEDILNEPKWYEKPPTIPSSIIFSYLSETVHMDGFERQTHSCYGMCGDFHHGQCSCRPSCLGLKTCCVDFAEACVSIEYSTMEIERNFSWLGEVNMECYNGDVIVTSCRNNGASRNDYASQSNATLRELHQQMAATRSPIDLMRLLVQTSSEYVNKTLSAEMEWLLSKIFIEDTSTGITFANASVYDCNGAQWLSARPGFLLIEFNYSELIPGERIHTFESISSYIDIMKSRSIPYSSTNPCHVDVISSCPSDYSDDQIKGACEHTNLFVATKNMYGDPASEKLFKNPFCQSCHIGLDPLHIMKCISFKKIGFVPYVKVIVTYKNILIQTIDITFEGISAWKTITCNLTDTRLPEPHSNGKSEKNVTGSSIQLTNTACVVTSCQLGQEKNNGEDCSFKIFFALLLPPAAYTLQSNEFFPTIFMPFAERFSQFMGARNVRFNDDSHRLYLRRSKFKSMNIQYTISSELSTGFLLLSFEDDGTIPWDELPRHLWSRSRFPFSNGSLYFCLLISRVPFGSWTEPSHRCWDVPEYIVYDNMRMGFTKTSENSHVYSSESRSTTNLAYCALLAILVYVLV